MQKRMPIGYKMINGKIFIDETKSQTVYRIFNEYLNGTGITALSKELTANRVLTGNNKTNWTHGAVGKILENIKYLGDDVHPQLIQKDIFDKVAKKRKQRIIDLHIELSPNSFQNKNVFSNKVFCGTCGDVYKIYLEHSGKPYEKRKWKCKKYIYKNKVSCRNLSYTKEELTEISLNAINTIIKTPELLDKKPTRYKPTKSSELVELEKQIDEQEKNELFASPNLKNLIFKRAMLTYNEAQIDSYNVHTELIKEVLSDTEALTELDEEIFKQIIDRITICEDGKVQTRFINGVILSEQYNQRKESKNGNS